MNKDIHLCVFDMAGTTIDEQNVVYKTLLAAINNQGYQLQLEQVCQHAAGKEKYQAIVDLLHEQTDCDTVTDTANLVFKQFSASLDQAYQTFDIKAFAGVSSLLQRLRSAGKKVILNTGYSRAIAEMLLQRINWRLGGEIDGLVTADDVEAGRPAPDMIYLAMEIAGVSDSELVLKAGDSVIDIEEGKNAGCGLTIGVLTGAQNRRQLETAEPDMIVEDLIALEHVLL